MSENKETGVAPKEAERGLAEYVPYGTQDKIKLSVKIVQNLIAVPTKTGKTCSDRDAIRFIAMCQAKRLNPFEGDAFLVGFDSKDGPNFTLITAHQTYLKRAELHPEFDGMESGVIVALEDARKDLPGDFVPDPYRLLGGWATVHFKTRKHPMVKRVRLETFKKPFGVWLDNAAGMIVKCAEADALRSAFPTMLGGLYLREELEGNLGAQERAEKFSRPMFSQPAAIDLPRVENGNTAAEGARAKTEPETSAPKPQSVQAAADGALIAVRGYCQRDEIPEGAVLDYLSEIGTTDGSYSSLDELAMMKPDTLTLVKSGWAGIVKNIKERSAAR